jgi:PhnB protein
MLDLDRYIGHVEVEIGDSVIMLFDARPGWPPALAHLRVYVGDVAAAIERAIAAGARVVTRPTMLAFGERAAYVRDPQVHLWRLDGADGGRRAWELVSRRELHPVKGSGRGTAAA